MLNRRQLLGQSGEKLAATFLKSRGYRIVERNFRCKYGEIDIIAYDGDCLVIVEVKTRTSSSFGTPAAAVGYTKQRQICRATQSYLMTRDIPDCAIRFDVVAIVRQGDSPAQIELFTDAFEFCL